MLIQVQLLDCQDVQFIVFCNLLDIENFLDSIGGGEAAGMASSSIQSKVFS